jgi:GNAT superfamily N-acetyltransferase
VIVRDARPEDWAQIWPFLQGICAAGETFTWPRDVSEQLARSIWMKALPGRTVVAVEDGLVIGTAETHPNQMGPGAHVANAGFLVHPEHGRKGVGRALGEHVIRQAREDGYHAMQFNAVVETNTPAVRLWQSLGFEVLTTVPDAYDHATLGLVGLNVMYRRL